MSIVAYHQKVSDWYAQLRGRVMDAGRVGLWRRIVSRHKRVNRDCQLLTRRHQ